MINIAQIGVGYWGPNLLRNLIENKNCIISDVIDTSSERRTYVKNEYPQIKVDDNIDIVLNNPNIDAIIVATPVDSHYEMSLKVLHAGKHLLVEKPMAKSIEEVENIGTLARKMKLVAMVGHTFLYNSAVRHVKQIIDSGNLGEIRYIYSQRVNLGRIRSDVDALWNFAPHDVSIIQYWLNDPNPLSVSRNGMDFVQKGIDDVVFLNIEYPNNIMANIHVSWLDPHKIRRATIVGSEKMLVYDDIADHKITVYDKGIDRMAILGENMDFDEQKNISFNHRSEGFIHPIIDWVEPLKVEIEHFIDCILNNTDCLTDSYHAKKVINILSMGMKK